MQTAPASPSEWSRVRLLAPALTGVAIGVLVLTGIRNGHSSGDLVFYGILCAYFTGLGALLVWRVPANRIGWLFLWISLAISLAGILWGYASEGNLIAEAVGGTAWNGFICALPLLLLWFPTGEVPSRHWRWVGWGTTSFIAACLLATLFSEALCRDGDGGVCREWVPNPIGVPGVPNPEYEGVLSSMLIAITLIGLASLVWRFRNGSPVERLQLKWFLLATGALAVTMTIDVASDIVGLAPGPWVDVANSISIATIPIAATLAILRYRLYEIDRVISRTVSYGLVIALLGGVYLASVSLLTTFLPSDNPLVVAVSTIAAAALFTPARRRILSIVDRQFNRSRFDAARVVEAFTASLGGEVDESGVLAGWMGVVEETMRPELAGVWVRST